MCKFKLFGIAIVAILSANPGKIQAQPTPAEEQLAKQIKKYEDILRGNPKDIEFWHVLGDLYIDAQQWDKAIEAHSTALKLLPGYAVAHASRGRAYFGKKDYKKAIEEFNEAIKLWEGKEGLGQYLTYRQPKTEFILSYRYRGIARANLSDYTDAIKDLNVTIQLDKNNPKWYKERAYIYGKLQKNEESAADYFFAGKVYLDSYGFSAAEACLQSLNAIGAHKKAAELEKLIAEKKKPRTDFDD